jgi:hypothetical protein
MTNGIGSKTFCLAVKVTWEEPRRIIDCWSKRFFFAFEPGPLARSPWALWRLEDCLSALQSMGEKRVFERIFKVLASEHDNEYMMIDATIVSAHQHSRRRTKKTANKRSADPAAD